MVLVVVLLPAAELVTDKIVMIQQHKQQHNTNHNTTPHDTTQQQKIVTQNYNKNKNKNKNNININNNINNNNCMLEFCLDKVIGSAHITDGLRISVGFIMRGKFN